MHEITELHSFSNLQILKTSPCPNFQTDPLAD